MLIDNEYWKSKFLALVQIAAVLQSLEYQKLDCFVNFSTFLIHSRRSGSFDRNNCGKSISPIFPHLPNAQLRSLIVFCTVKGYHHDLIPVTVAGIPSMHICLEFIPMLMQQPDYDKLIFGVDLLSHICVQYSIPRAFTVSRLAFSILNTLLGSKKKKLKFTLILNLHIFAMIY